MTISLKQLLILKMLNISNLEASEIITTLNRGAYYTIRALEFKGFICSERIFREGYWAKMCSITKEGRRELKIWKEILKM